MLTGDMPHETWDARESFAWALAAPVVLVAEGREGWGWRRRFWARHNGSSHPRLHSGDARDWMDAEGAAKGAGVGGGQPRCDGPEKSENGNCELAGAMSCGRPPGAGGSVEEPPTPEETAGVAWPGTGGRGSGLPAKRELRDLL